MKNILALLFLAILFFPVNASTTIDERLTDIYFANGVGAVSHDISFDQGETPVLISEKINNKFFRNSIMFNTKNRMEAYIEYDRLLSGSSYSTPDVNIYI